MSVVIGGASGIGRAIAERLLRAGATVVIGDLADLPAADLDELCTLGKVTCHPLDVGDWDRVAEFFDEVGRTHGDLDVCVNSAGVQWIAPSLQLDRDAWERVIRVNLTGLFACAQAAGRLMAERGGGAIVNLASAIAVRAVPGRAPYCSSKAGVIALTKVLGVEWAPLGIRVNALAPGWVDTELVRRAIDEGKLLEADVIRRTPLGRLATPAEIAEVALFLASDASSYMTGQTIFPDGGFTASGA